MGLGDLFVSDEKAVNPIIGDAFALCAMAFWAAEMTYLEKYVKKYDVEPMKALGLNGVFSLLILTLLLFGFYFLEVPFDMGQPNGVMEDAIDGFIQLSNNPKLLFSFICKYYIFFEQIRTEIIQFFQLLQSL